MVRIVLRPGEPISISIKRFRKIVEREGIIKEIKKHSYFETKSQIRRRKNLKSIRRLQNQNAEDNAQANRGKGVGSSKKAQSRR